MPFRNPRLVPYIRKDWVEDGKWKLTEYDQRSRSERSGLVPKMRTYVISPWRETFLLEGAFNVNSTSVNAWVAHLTALKGNKGPWIKYVTSNETPFPRFFDEIDENSWNKVCTLDDSEVRELAKSLSQANQVEGPVSYLMQILLTGGFWSNLNPIP